MTDLALFVVCKGRIDVQIGAHIVATIFPTAKGARYRVLLPGAGIARRTRLVNSEKKARRLVLHRLAGWFEDAGLGFAGVAQALARQIESQREVDE